MATIIKKVLGGSTHGQGIMVSNTGGQTNINVHTLSTSLTTVIDEMFVYAQNNYSEAVKIAFEIGGSQSGLQIVAIVQPQDGPQLVIPGLILTGSACAVSAFVGGLNGSASPAVSGSAMVCVYGYVNRITQ